MYDDANQLEAENIRTQAWNLEMGKGMANAFAGGITDFWTAITGTDVWDKEVSKGERSMAAGGALLAVVGIRGAGQLDDANSLWKTNKLVGGGCFVSDTPADIEVALELTLSPSERLLMAILTGLLGAVVVRLSFERKQRERALRRIDDIFADDPMHDLWIK